MNHDLSLILLAGPDWYTEQANLRAARKKFITAKIFRYTTMIRILTTREQTSSSTRASFALAFILSRVQVGAEETRRNG